MHKYALTILFTGSLALVFSTASANLQATKAFPPLQSEIIVGQGAAGGDTVLKSKPADTLQLNKNNLPLSISDTLSENQKKKKRITAFCAFPFPFGFVAAHRVMLGTKPWVPIVYVATFGGCFGLLPLIDFCVLLTSKNPEQYENNPNIFMWMK